MQRCSSGKKGTALYHILHQLRTHKTLPSQVACSFSAAMIGKEASFDVVDQHCCTASMAHSLSAAVYLQKLLVKPLRVAQTCQRMTHSLVSRTHAAAVSQSPAVQQISSLLQLMSHRHVLSSSSSNSSSSSDRQVSARGLSLYPQPLQAHTRQCT